MTQLIGSIRYTVKPYILSTLLLFGVNKGTLSISINMLTSAYDYLKIFWSPNWVFPGET